MTLSVTIPNYNGGKTIQNVIECVLEQVPTGTEIIVVDDASTDDSIEIIETCFEHVCVYRNDEHKGIAAIRNQCIKHSKGEWIFFIDSDLKLQPKCFELLYKTTEYSDISFPTILYMNGAIMYPNGEPESSYLLITPVFLLRRSALTRLSNPIIFDETFLYRSEDTDFFLRAFLAGLKSTYVPDALAVHDVNLNPRNNETKYYLEVRNSIYGAIKYLGIPGLNRFNHSFKTINIIKLLVCGLFNFNLFDMQARGYQKRGGLRYTAVLLLKAPVKLTPRGRFILIYISIKAIRWNIRHLFGTLAAGKQMRRELRIVS